MAFDISTSPVGVAKTNQTFNNTFTTQCFKVTQAGAVTVGPSNGVGGHQFYGSITFSKATSGGAFAISSNMIAAGAGTYPVKWSNTTGNLSYDTSSRLVKTDIEPSPYGLSEVLSLLPRKYTRTDGNYKEVGLIADEVVDTLPELVPMVPKSLFTNDEADTDLIPGGVNYDKLTAVLVKAIQELSAKVDSLQAELNTYKGQ
jgi:hypothetical protein